MIVQWMFLGGDASEVALVAAAIRDRVAVQDFAPETTKRQAEAVVRPQNRREIQNDEEMFGAGPVLADEGHDAVLVVGAVQPEKSFHRVITVPQRRLGLVKQVQIGNELLQATMERALVEQPPVERGVGVPLAALAELAAHEEQLLAGETPLVAEQGAEIGEGLPVVAGHPPDQRVFAMHHFVVR